jgi:hypothetical protein
VNTYCEKGANSKRSDRHYGRFPFLDTSQLLVQSVAEIDIFGAFKLCTVSVLVFCWKVAFRCYLPIGNSIQREGRKMDQKRLWSMNRYKKVLLTSSEQAPVAVVPVLLALPCKAGPRPWYPPNGRSRRYD